MPHETMTPRERWLAVLTRQVPDRVATDYWATEEMSARLHVDRPLTVGPVYVGPPVPEGYDVFGLQYREVDYGTGTYRECIAAPLSEYETVGEIEQHYAWPDPDWWDYTGIPA